MAHSKAPSGALIQDLEISRGLCHLDEISETKKRFSLAMGMYCLS